METVPLQGSTESANVMYAVEKFASSTRKAFRGPKKGHFPEIDEQVQDKINLLRQEGMPVTRENIQVMAMQAARSLGLTRVQFKASYGWARRFMKRCGFSLRRRTSLAQRMPADFEEKLMSYQKYVISLRTQHQYLDSQIGNADQTPVYFDMPSNTTVNLKGEKSIHIKTTGNEKQRCTVMLSVLADGRKFPPYVIFKRKNFSEKSCHFHVNNCTGARKWRDARAIRSK